MKKLLFILLTVFSFAATGQNTLPKPNPPRLVNDAAKVLSPEQVEILERKLVAFDDSTSNQIVVVLIKTLGDYAIEDYAVKLFRDWGIGNKKTNNGILILAAIDDRKVRIEVGYGLEGAIPDITSASIIRNDIVPNFKAGNYYRGIDQAIESVSKAAAGEYKVVRERAPDAGGSRSGGGSIFPFIFIIIIIISIIGRSGRGGGGGGMMRGSGFSNIATGILLSNLLGGGRGGGWGSGGGGGGWSGGGGGGGFGGFGGGSSGGGGASGSW